MKRSDLSFLKQWLDNILTRDEQKILGYLFTFFLMGMILYYSGYSAIYATQESNQDNDVYKKAVPDSVLKVDIRSATAEQLDMLPGIGPERAQDILDYRKIRQFQSTDELLNVKGIGIKTLEKMRPMLLRFGKPGAGVKDRSDLIKPGKSRQNRSSGSSKADASFMVSLNTASLKELMSLSGIGEKKAQAVIDYREENGDFTSIEQFTEVKGIGPGILEKNRHRLKL